MEVSQQCVKIFLGTCFADVPLARCERKPSYCSRLQDAIDVDKNVVKEVPGRQRWFFDKLYINTYFIRRGTH